MDPRLKLLLEKDEVIDRISELFIATDNRDWRRVEQCFAPQVLFDMTSLAGGEAVTLSPEEISAAWKRGLEPVQAIHHQAGNFRVKVDGGEAEAFCYGIASHYLSNPSGRNTRTFVGSYEFHLTRTRDDWRVDKFKFNLKYLDGNPDLESLAESRG